MSLNAISMAHRGMSFNAEQMAFRGLIGDAQAATIILGLQPPALGVEGFGRDAEIHATVLHGPKALIAFPDIKFDPDPTSIEATLRAGPSTSLFAKGPAEDPLDEVSRATTKTSPSTSVAFSKTPAAPTVRPAVQARAPAAPLAVVVASPAPNDQSPSTSSRAAVTKPPKPSIARAGKKSPRPLAKPTARKGAIPKVTVSRPDPPEDED